MTMTDAERAAMNVAANRVSELGSLPFESGWLCARRYYTSQARPPLDFTSALAVAQSVFDQYAVDQRKWWKRMDGTPILNDVAVRMAQAFLDAAPASAPAPTQQPAPIGAQPEQANDDNSENSDRGQQGVRSEGDGAGTHRHADGGESGTVHNEVHPRRAAVGSKGGGRLPLAFTNEWLRDRIASDQDDEPGAGNAAGSGAAPDAEWLDWVIKVLRNRDLEIPEFHAMQVPIASALTALRARVAELERGSAGLVQAAEDLDAGLTNIRADRDALAAQVERLTKERDDAKAEASRLWEAFTVAALASLPPAAGAGEG